MENNGASTYLRKTLRSAAFVGGFVVLMLLSYDQAWAVVPLLGGALLAAGLLYGWKVLVERVFTPPSAGWGRGKKDGASRTASRALAGFALVKYPLVALVLWAVTRLWTLREVMAFASGFILLHTVIGLRAMGHYLVEQSN